MKFHCRFHLISSSVAIYSIGGGGGEPMFMTSFSKLMQSRCAIILINEMLVLGILFFEFLDIS